MGCEEEKAKYVMPNPLPRSLPPKIVEEDKCSLFDVDSEEEAIPCEDEFARVATTHVEYANPSVELGEIDVVISDPVVDKKNLDSRDL